MKSLFIIFVIPLLCLGQFQFIPVSADYASFSLNDSLAYIEVYLGYYQGSLTYIANPQGGLIASFSNKIEVKQDGKVIQQQTHHYQNTTDDTSSRRIYNQFVDIFQIQARYGKYQVRLQLDDHHSNLKGEYVIDVNTIVHQPGIYFSDMELCSEIKQDTTKSIFYKNGLKVLPNPGSIFDMLHPMLYFYIELNNLRYDPNQNRVYAFEYFITSTAGDTVKKKAAIKKVIKANSQIEIGGLNVMALAQNAYYLNARAIDLETGQVAETKRRFGVYKPSSRKDSSVAETAKKQVSNLYIIFNKEQLLEEFQLASYLATRTEEKVFKNLENEDAMRKFLTQFWMDRDTQAQLSPGLSRHRYLLLVEYANQNYGSMGRAGWKTDRGRILLIYNEPDEIERYPSSMDQIPYQIWRYHNLEGGAFFVFADVDGFGDYRLIHSTYRKELQNPGWEGIINKQTSLTPSAH
jgi:GWxTD domain-containing protein